MVDAHKQQEVQGSGAKDMLEGSSFFNLSFGTPRHFDLIDSDGHVKWSEYLGHGSLLKVSFEANRDFKHAVPPDEHWTGAARCSVIFRTSFGICKGTSGQLWDFLDFLAFVAV